MHVFLCCATGVRPEVHGEGSRPHHQERRGDLDVRPACAACADRQEDGVDAGLP